MSELDRIREVYQSRSSSGDSDRYSLFRPGELLMIQRREEVTLARLAEAGCRSLSGMRILEVGCGRGTRLAEFQRWGAAPESIHGVDLLEPFVTRARRDFPSYAVVQASGHQLPYADASFDIVCQSTVFTSIREATLRAGMAAEMLRVLKPGGLALWYDMRYPSLGNPNVHPIGRSEIRRLFRPHSVRVVSLTLLPPLARQLAPLSFGLCRLLELLPFLRSHYLALIRKAGTPDRGMAGP